MRKSTTGKVGSTTDVNTNSSLNGRQRNAEEQQHLISQTF